MTSPAADLPLWAAVLPSAARREFAAEVLAACAVEEGDPVRRAVVVAAWQATAEAYTDPAVALDGSDLDYLAEPAPVPDPRTT